MEFFNNKENEILKFKINIDGIDINNIEPRLLLTNKENKNFFLFGKIKDSICEFEIPELKIYEKGDHGKIKFEIISDDLYFSVWEDKFDIISKVSIKIEEMTNEINNIIKNKPKISLSEDFIVEKPIIKKEEKVKVVKENTTNYKTEPIFNPSEDIIKDNPVIKKEEKVEPLKESTSKKVEQKEEIYKKTENKGTIRRFDSF